jgi:hypothetical protein
MEINFLFIKATYRTLLMSLGLIFTVCLCSLDANAQSSLAVSTVEETPTVVGDMPWESDATQLTRADIMAMNEGDRKEVLSNIKNYNITDLVNATPEVMEPRLDNLTYMKVVEFYFTSMEIRLKAILFPGDYIIYQ